MAVGERHGCGVLGIQNGVRRRLMRRRRHREDKHLNFCMVTSCEINETVIFAELLGSVLCKGRIRGSPTARVSGERSQS